jgi:acetyltransferase-like isoleucine patch superfamily enzyme
MKSVLKFLILIFRNSPLFSTYGFRKFRWFLFRKYYNAPGLYVDERVVIAIAHTNKNAYFKCAGEVNIGLDVYIDYSGGVEIKNKVAISEGAKIFTHNHSIHDGEKNWKENPIVFSPILIEDYVWIGADAIILPSVELIAEGSIIAAGAVLTKSTEAYGIYGGNPATKIGNRRINEK